MPQKKHKYILWKYWFDTSIIYGGLIGSLVTLPQIINIWQAQNVSGLSLISWTGYTFGAFIWLIYGIVHNEKPIIYTYILSFPMYLLIVIGILMFK